MSGCHEQVPFGKTLWHRFIVAYCTDFCGTRRIGFSIAQLSLATRRHCTRYQLLYVHECSDAQEGNRDDGATDANDLRPYRRAA